MIADIMKHLTCHSSLRSCGKAILKTNWQLNVITKRPLREFKGGQEEVGVGSSHVELLKLGFMAQVSKGCSCTRSFPLGQATLEVGILGVAHKVHLEHIGLLSTC